MGYGNLQKYQNPNPLQRLLINRFQSNIRRLIGDLKIGNVLDVGCGEGYTLRFLKEKFPHIKMTGLDSSVSALGLARKINPGLEFIPGDACRTRMPNSCYDLVLCLEVIEHIKNYSRVISELKRVSSRYCLISVPWEPFFSLINFLRLRQLRRLGRDPEHLNFFSLKKIKQAVGAYFIINKVIISFPWIIILTKKR